MVTMIRYRHTLCRKAGLRFSDFNWKGGGGDKKIFAIIACFVLTFHFQGSAFEADYSDETRNMIISGKTAEADGGKTVIIELIN